MTIRLIDGENIVFLRLINKQTSNYTLRIKNLSSLKVTDYEILDISDDPCQCISKFIFQVDNDNIKMDGEGHYLYKILSLPDGLTCKEGIIIKKFKESTYKSYDYDKKNIIYND